MLASRSLKPLAPSIPLLRFLRSQSESLCFFTPNSPSCGCSTAEDLPWCWHPGDSATQTTSSWSRINPAPCRAQLEASLFSIIGPLANNSKTPRFLPPLSSIRPSSRNVTTKNRPLFRRLLDLTRSKSAAKRDCSPSLVDDSAEGNLFNLGRTLAAKTLNEPCLRCTEFDGNGNVTLVNGEYKKSELIAKYGLLPRDLRKIDSSLLPHILVRSRAILISLLHLRVLIKADKVLVFDVYGSTDSYAQSVFMYDLEGKLQQKQAQTTGALPYEFRALEAVLISVTSGLEGEFESVREPVVRVLRALEEDIDRDKLRHLLIYSKKLGSFEQKARLVRDAIEDLLEADDDLAAMYLSERANGVERPENDHQEVEMLLESYHKVCDEIVQASGNLVTAIRSTEEVVKAILDANRNSLMLLDLKFSIGTLGLASGTLISALYGMNLKNFIEESDLGFGLISAACVVFSAFVSLYGLMKLRKLQRVRMWGEGGVGTSVLTPISTRRSGSIGGLGNWRSDAIEPVIGVLPGEGRFERMKRLKEKAATPAAVSNVDARRVVPLRASSPLFSESEKANHDKF